MAEEKYNVENLIPFNELTESKQREIASKGGKASVEARRARKTLKEELLLLLKEEKVQETISLALIQEAIEGNNSGSVTKAFEVIRDTIGEKPKEEIQVEDITPKWFKKSN